MITTQAARPVSTGHPRVYRVKAKYRVLTSVLLVLLGVPAVAGVFYFGTGRLAKNHRAAVQLAVFCGVIALGTLYAAIASRVSRITAWRDRIEVEGLFRKRSLLRQELLGIRTDSSSEDAGRIFFESRDHTQTSISRMYEFDEVFEDWMSSLKDLDGEERRASEQSIKDNEQFGRRRLDRVHALRRADRVAKWLNLGAFVLFFWGCFVRVPSNVSIAALVVYPWLTIIMAGRSRGLYTFEQNRTDVRPRLTIPYLLPGIALLMRVFLEVKLVDWKGSLYFTITAASVLAIAALIAGRPWINAKGWAVVIFVLALPYGFGASMQGNVRLDQSEPQQIRARVVSKEKHNSRDSFYYLELAPWGPHAEFDRVGVQFRIYDSVAVGDDICIALHKGAFRVPWYTIGLCGNDQKESAKLNIVLRSMGDLDVSGGETA